MSDHRHFPHVPGIAGNGDPEPGPGELIRAGHRGVLETFREFAREIGDDDGDLDPEVLRAVIAFLRQGLLPFCITIDREAGDYLPYMFGANGYTLIKDPQQLPFRLPQLYKQLTQG